jgi:nucleotide-binding universal stress UspA family protein
MPEGSMYPKILVPVDGSTASVRALQEAVELARRLESTLVLLHVADTYPLLLSKASQDGFDEARELLLRQAQALLDTSRRAVDQAGVPCEAVLREVMSSRVASAILEEAYRRQCALIVMGMHGRNGRTRLPLGSDAEHVLQAATVPVLLVREDKPEA